MKREVSQLMTQKLEQASLRVCRQDKKPNCKKQSQSCGKVCIPEKYQCRINQKSRKSYEATLRAEEDKIRGLSYERAVTIDQKGKVLSNIGGDKSSVSFTGRQVREMKGNIVTHNHPINTFPKGDARRQGLSFSEDDVRLFHIAEVSEGRVVTDGKYDYSMKPPPGKTFSTWFYLTKVNPSLKKRKTEVAQEYWSKVQSSQMRYDKAEANFYHEIWSRVARDTGIQYKRSVRS